MRLSRYFHGVAVRHEATENHALVDLAYEAHQKTLNLEHALLSEAARGPVSIERIREILATGHVDAVGGGGTH